MCVGAVPRLQLEGWLYRDCKHLLHHLDAATLFELLQDNTKGGHKHVVLAAALALPAQRCTPVLTEASVTGVHTLCYTCTVLTGTGQSC